MSDPDPGGDDARRPSTPLQTLYAARMSDPRERAAQPVEQLRGRAPRRATDSSDVTRFRGILAATAAGAVAAGLAALLLPPAGGLDSPGPLSRPHAQAKLECASCHTEDARSASPAKPASTSGRASAADPEVSPFVASARGACVGCHGPHPSTRRGHQRVAAAGQLGCASCHAIHRSDQGVSFAPSATPVRFAPGIAVEEPRVVFHPPGPTTVPIVTAGACARCHDLASARDPIARCLVPGQEALADARPIVCFDEHQLALPADERAAQDRGRGVCASQHGTERAHAWEAAREAAVLAPVVSSPVGGRSHPVTWIGVGIGAAGLALVVVRGADRLRARRRRRLAATPDALLKAPARVRLPQIDVNTCIGCYACVDACPYDVLAIERYVAVVARPDACCGLSLCEQRCPNGSLVITDGALHTDQPRVGDSFESLDAPGVYLAGDVTGLPLIKNAILQGARAVEQIAASLDRAPAGDGEPPLDLVVVGAGPAGISAALRAKELGIRYEVVEQGSVAESIKSFPRGKLVFDQPLELPITGKLWLKEASKEELLVQWMRIVRQERLVIRQDTRFVRIERGPGWLDVITEPRESLPGTGPVSSLRTRRVLLAIGRRGSPRRLPLPIPEDAEARVHYHLSDARSFAGQRVVVVGLGDVAMETAIAVARQPETTVTVIHRGEGFQRGKARNVDEMKRMQEAGRVRILFGSEIEELDHDRASVRTPSGSVALGYDALLVMIGSIPPWSTLEAAGVQRGPSLASPEGQPRPGGIAASLAGQIESIAASSKPQPPP